MKRNPYNERMRKEATPRALKARKLRESGLTWAQIGKLLGVTRQRAMQIATRPL